MKKTSKSIVYAKKSTTYNADSIQRFAGLLGMRKRSSIYIGPNDSTGLWTLVREGADNISDLVTKNIVKKIQGKIIFDPSKTAFWIVDDGPGFPVGVKEFMDEKGKKEKLNTFYAATGLLHTGSNFDTDTNSRGVNGAGIKCVVAMSKTASIWTCANGKWYSIHYKNAKLFKDVSLEKPPKLPHGLKGFGKGTIVYFEPDMSLFEDTAKVELSVVDEWATITTILVDNINMEVITKKGKIKKYSSAGIPTYLDKRLADAKATSLGKPFIYKDNNLSVALHFANAEEPSLLAYTNGLFNVGGGEHVKVVQNAIVKSLKPFAPKKADYKPVDLFDGIVGLVDAKLAAPKFNVQTKDVLLDTRIAEVTGDKLVKAFTEFWNKNKTLAKEVISRATLLRKQTDDFLKDKKLIKKVKSASKGMSDKFADVSSQKVPIEQRELYIVEGDSAGGTAKKARDKTFQATFAIRGKPLNVLDSTKDKINNNNEVAGILAGIGVGHNSKDDKAIRFGKIIFLADPDVDGYHINCLLLGLFWHFTPHLFEEGKIFMTHAPEFIAEYKNKYYYGMTAEDIYKQIDTKKVEIRHIKGWGELQPDEMAPISFEPTRQLIRILPPKSSKGKLNFEALMSGKGNYRKVLLGIISEDEVEEAKSTTKSPVKKIANSNKSSKATIKTAVRKKAA